MNTLHSYQFEGAGGMLKMQGIMKMFRCGFDSIGGLAVERVLDYSEGHDGLPKSESLKYLLAGGSSVVIRPSGTEPKLEAYISITSDDKETAAEIEKLVAAEIENIIYIDERMGYCSE